MLWSPKNQCWMNSKKLNAFLPLLMSLWRHWRPRGWEWICSVKAGLPKLRLILGCTPGACTSNYFQKSWHDDMEIPHAFAKHALRLHVHGRSLSDETPLPGFIHCSFCRRSILLLLAYMLLKDRNIRRMALYWSIISGFSKWLHFFLASIGPYWTISGVAFRIFFI